jgi:hypothetical protein
MKPTHEKKVLSTVRMLRKNLDWHEKRNKEMEETLVACFDLLDQRAKGLSEAYEIAQELRTLRKRLPDKPPEGEGQYVYLLECIQAMVNHWAYLIEKAVIGTCNKPTMDGKSDKIILASPWTPTKVVGEGGKKGRATC